MKGKLFTYYVYLFTLFTFFSSAICVYELLDKLNIPSGILHAIVYYGYFLVHIASFVAMIYYYRQE